MENLPIENKENEFDGLVVFPLTPQQADLWNSAIEESENKFKNNAISDSEFVDFSIVND